MEIKFKEIISNKDKEFRIFIKKFKDHLEKNDEAKDILLRYITGKEVSEKELEFMKFQSIELIKSLGIGIPTILIPGGLALLAFIIFLSKRFKIDILPSYLKSS
jgi:hypothetical protein